MIGTKNGGVVEEGYIVVLGRCKPLSYMSVGSLRHGFDVHVGRTSLSQETFCRPCL